VREVGTGDSFAGKLGVTVRAGAGTGEAAGLEAVVEVVGMVLGGGVPAAGLAAEGVVELARGTLFANAEEIGEEQKLRCGILHVVGADLDAEMAKESPLRARETAITCDA
jgi:hypothetical protein